MQNKEFVAGESFQKE